MKPDVATHEGARHLTLQSRHRSAAHRPLSRTTQGKASGSCATCREGVERRRCCSLPRRQTRKSAISRRRPAWRRQRAWHRPREKASDGNALLSYSSPTPLATGVGATPYVSGKRLRRSGRSRSVSTEAECHNRAYYTLSAVEARLIFVTTHEIGREPQANKRRSKNGLLVAKSKTKLALSESSQELKYAI